MSSVSIKNDSIEQLQVPRDLSEDEVTQQIDIPSGYFTLLMEYTSYAMICVATFGFTGNILIIITYAKIGFSDSINISYFALGVSDILCVTCLTWNAICFIPAFADSELPFLSREFVIPTGGFTSDMFQKTTAWITAYISLERCLCVVFPLKVKAIVRRKRTILILVLLFVLTVVPMTSVVSYTYVLDVRFHAGQNRTLLGVRIRNSSLSGYLTHVNYLYKLIFLNSIPFAVILLSSIVLAVHLNRSALWRLGKSQAGVAPTGKSLSNDDKANRKYSKDMRIVKTVLAIALAFIFLGTMSNLRILIAMNLPEFRPIGTYAKLFRFSARLVFLLSIVNSSVNFFIYFMLGTKFRDTLTKMILGNQNGEDRKK